MVLIGEPGSGKSTALYHLAWSHMAAYQGNFSDALLLSSSQAPLVSVFSELHRLPASHCHHPDDTFLSSVIEVLVRKDGIEVDYRSQRSTTSSLPCTFCEKGALTFPMLDVQVLYWREALNVVFPDFSQVCKCS
jgi:hypothetical protein